MFSTGTQALGKADSDAFYKDIRLALRAKGNVRVTFQHVWQRSNMSGNVPTCLATLRFYEVPVKERQQQSRRW